MTDGHGDAEFAASAVVGELAPELYEDEVYLWEVASVLRRLAARDPRVAAVLERGPAAVAEVTLAAVAKIVALPGVETFFTGWPLEGDWLPRRA